MHIHLYICSSIITYVQVGVYIVLFISLFIYVLVMVLVAMNQTSMYVALGVKRRTLNRCPSVSGLRLGE